MLNSIFDKHRRSLLIFIDLFAIVISFFGAFLLRFDFIFLQSTAVFIGFGYLYLLLLSWLSLVYSGYIRAFGAILVSGI